MPKAFDLHLFVDRDGDWCMSITTDSKSLAKKIPFTALHRFLIEVKANLEESRETNVSTDDE